MLEEQSHKRLEAARKVKKKYSRFLIMLVVTLLTSPLFVLIFGGSSLAFVIAMFLGSFYTAYDLKKDMIKNDLKDYKELEKFVEPIVKKKEKSKAEQKIERFFFPYGLMIIVLLISFIIFLGTMQII